MKSMKWAAICWLATFWTLGICLGPGRCAGAGPRVFHGLDLAEFRRMQRLGAMPETYEMDPATRRYRLVDTVVQLPLEGAWITYNPTRNVFYLNNVPGENAASYFGPIEGDPFDMFKIEAGMTAKFRKEYASDELYRVSLMIRSGHPKLKQRAFRIMLAALAPDVSGEVRAYHVGKFRELTSDLKGDDVAPVLAAIKQTEQRIEELTVTIPESQYAPGNEALENLGKFSEGMKPSVPVPESAWGAPSDGLRAAAVISSVTAEVGQKLTVWLLVENVSEHPIKFGSSDVMQSARAVVQRTDGTDVTVNAAWYTGLSPIERHKLQPKERLTLAKKSLVFENIQGGGAVGFGGGRAVAGPGEYRVHYDSVLATGSAWSRDPASGEMHRTYPAKGEWSGTLATGDTQITVR